MFFLYIFPSPPISPDRGPPKKWPKPQNDVGFPFGSQTASWLTRQQARFNYTHAEGLTDSTEEESMLSVLYDLPCWWEWLTRWSSGEQLSLESVHTLQAAWLMTHPMIKTSCSNAFCCFVLGVVKTIVYDFIFSHSFSLGKVFFVCFSSTETVSGYLL